MIVAGLRVSDDEVRELARLVDEPTRSVLARALALGTAVVALTIEDRERAAVGSRRCSYRRLG
jgi:hypothetical protein